MVSPSVVYLDMSNRRHHVQHIMHVTCHHVPRITHVICMQLCVFVYLAGCWHTARKQLIYPEGVVTRLGWRGGAIALCVCVCVRVRACAKSQTRDSIDRIPSSTEQICSDSAITWCGLMGAPTRGRPSLLSAILVAVRALRKGKDL